MPADMRKPGSTQPAEGKRLGAPGGYSRRIGFWPDICQKTLCRDEQSVAFREVVRKYPDLLMQERDS
jgi:hypothetical protein